VKYSVLTSVYYSDNPEYLIQSIESMLRQTVPPDEIVLVCDGPLTGELDAVIDGYGDALNVVRLKENQGLGEALNIGIGHCRNELVARMDSDDISLPDRCEKQLAAFEADSELGLVGGTIEEFSEETGETMRKRLLPENHDEIVAFSKKRCPFNHPAVMYKKSEVTAAGGYTEEYHCFEDYDLWVRMLKNGCKSRNLTEVILRMRVSDASYERRGGKEYANTAMRFYRYMRRIGWIGVDGIVFGAWPQVLVCHIPNRMRKSVYRLLRKS